jgi:hypothetical protein
MDYITRCFQCAENINPADPRNSLGAKLRGSEGDFDVEFHSQCWYDFEADQKNPGSRAARYTVLIREMDISQH